jgi:polyphosphate kinase
VIFPVYDQEIREEILEMMNCQLSDNTKLRILDMNLANLTPPDHLKSPRKRAQLDFYNYLKKKYSVTRNH